MFSLKKYRNQILINLITLCVLVIAEISYLGANVGNPELVMTVAIFFVIATVSLLPGLIGFTYLYFSTRKKLHGAEIKEGIVKDCGCPFSRKSRTYIVIESYKTPNIFSRYSAKDCVGSYVKYAVIDDRAVIIEFID